MRLKTFSVSVLVIFLILAGIFVYLFEPYITLDRERVSTTPIEIETIYVNVTGEPGCAKLYKLDMTNKQNPVTTNFPVFLYLPDDMASPENGNYSYSDNMFTLKGYEYKWVKKNLVTGKNVEYPAERFDVIYWRIHPPYKIWASMENSDQLAEGITSNYPIEYVYKSTEYNSAKFVGRNSIDCLK